MLYCEHTLYQPNYYPHFEASNSFEHRWTSYQNNAWIKCQFLWTSLTQWPNISVAKYAQLIYERNSCLIQLARTWNYKWRKLSLNGFTVNLYTSFIWTLTGKYFACYTNYGNISKCLHVWGIKQLLNLIYALVCTYN